jgi:hypothetical protein
MKFSVVTEPENSSVISFTPKLREKPSWAICWNSRRHIKKKKSL